MVKKIFGLLSMITCFQVRFAQDLNKELSSVKWRSIGPFRGGRSWGGGMGEGARKQKLLVTLLRLILGETEPRPNLRK